MPHRSFRRAPAALALLAAVLLTGGCDGTAASAGAPRTTAPAASPTPAAASPARASEFDPSRDAAADLRAALRTARAGHREVLVDFGADWCPDCIVLGGLLRTPQVAPLLGRDYVVVRVNVGRFDRNLQLAARYVHLDTSGIPALVVLRADGTKRTDTSDGSFSGARSMTSAQVAAFLRRWAAGSR